MPYSVSNQLLQNLQGFRNMTWRSIIGQVIRLTADQLLLLKPSSPHAALQVAHHCILNPLFPEHIASCQHL